MLMTKDNQKIVNINTACKYAIYNQGTESTLLDNTKNVYSERVKHSTNANENNLSKSIWSSVGLRQDNLCINRKIKVEDECVW
jgi:hypothetical protein